MKRPIYSVKDWLGVIAALTLHIADHFTKLGEPLTIIIKRGPKTLEQLGYFHVEVLPGLTRALFLKGEIKQNSEAAAKLWLKMYMGYGDWYQINGQPLFDAYSFEDAKVDDMIKAIDTATDQAQERGEYIAPPSTNPKPSRRKNVKINN